MKKLIIFLGLWLSFSLSAQTKQYNSVKELPDYAVLRTKMKLDDVYTKADTPAEFPGGMETFKREFSEKMDVIDVKSKKINTRVYFIVEKTTSQPSIRIHSSKTYPDTSPTLWMKR